MTSQCNASIFITDGDKITYSDCKCGTSEFILETIYGVTALLEAERVCLGMPTLYNVVMCLRGSNPCVLKTTLRMNIKLLADMDSNVTAKTNREVSLTPETREMGISRTGLVFTILQTEPYYYVR